MKKIILLAVLVGFSQLTFAQETSETEKKDYSKEPKSSIVITIDGEEYTVEEGKEIEIKTKKGKSKISAKRAEEKLFDNGKYSFKYKKHFAFEYEGEFGYQNWTLDGNNCTIMMFELLEDATLDLFVQQMTAQFGKDNCEITKTSRKFGKKKLKGKRIEVNIVGQTMHLYMYEIKMNDGKTHIIAIQDSLDDENKPTKEAKDAMDLMDESITYKNE